MGAGLGVGTLGLLPFMAGFGLVGGGTLGAASRAMFRKLYVFSMNRGLHAMEGLLGTLNVSVVSDWGGGVRPSIVGGTAAQGELSKPAE